MDAAQFHEHYLLQARWLAPARHYLFRKAGLARRKKVLDLGCGSGIIADEMRQVCGRPVLAVDRDPAMVGFARGAYPENEYRIGDENTLAREGSRFDLVVISFVLMWQSRPLLFLKKVRKLLGADGTLLVLAEPDYGGRIDFPAPLDFLKDIFISHIAKTGGDPFIGRRLASLLDKAGFKAETELASALHFPDNFVGDTWEREWRFWQELSGFHDSTLNKILRLEKSAALTRERLVLFPVFCALATPSP
ncbi:MAG: methyltransferase domain-containing protein [Acidobacteriota bacterium]|nr:methyltransferase domain-containing protein [Acidobacteriota bacterium]